MRRRGNAFRAGVSGLLAVVFCAVVSAADPSEDLDAAAILMADGRHAEAAVLLERVVQAAPRLDDAWHTLAWAYRHQDRLDRAREILETWRRMEPEGATVHVELGGLALAQGRLEDAVGHYRDAVERDPGQTDLRFRLGQTLRWIGHLGEAIRHLRPLYEDRPDDSEVRREFARALLSNWEFEEAATLWSRILVDDPNDREARLADAQAALHTGRRLSAVLSARRLVDEDPENVQAWQLLADAAQYDDRLAEAVEALQAWHGLSTDPDERSYLYARRMAVQSRLHERDPQRFGRAEVLAMARAYAAEFPDLPYAQLGLAEAYIGAGRYTEAGEIFLRVIRESNRRNLRALRGLVDVSIGLGRVAEAEFWLERVRAFNPSDPYLAYDEAQVWAAQGDFRGARAALDRLEEAGRRGAAAVLLYHALTASPYGPALHVHRFRDHIRALLLEGYALITPDELHAYWAGKGASAGVHPDGRIRRVALITFDDALESAQRFGTPVALEYGVRFAQHIPVGNVLRGDPYICSWEELREYGATGAWVYGSHLLFAHDATAASRNGGNVNPMSSRLWIEDEDRLETEAEYFARLREEYERSQALIREELGHAAEFVAYPYGDIGQELISNVPEAIPVNLTHARNLYRIGFVQAPMAHAVRGSEPLLYPRHEMDITASGAETVRYLLDRHPVILADRTRYAMALEQGRAAQARASLRRLRAAGYPLAELRALERRLRPEMARAFAVPDLGPPRGAVDPGPWGLRAGAEFSAFRNRLDAHHLRGIGAGELTHAPHFMARAEAGAGAMRQNPEDGGPAVSIEEYLGVLAFSWVGEDRTVVTLGGGWRGLDGSSRDGIALGSLEVHGRATPALDLRFRLDRDGMDEAAVLARGTTRNRWLLQAAWEPADAWQVGISGQHDVISDGNDRTQVRLAPVCWGPDSDGWRWGGVYGFTRSDRERPDYWTPESLHTVQALAGHRWRGTLGLLDISIQTGWGRERAHPRERAAEDRAEDEEQDEGGSARWRPAFAVQAWWAFPFGQRFSGGVDVGYNRSPEYDEMRGQIRGAYRF